MTFYHYSPYKDAEVFAREYDKKLKATDFHSKNCVYILHEEGTQLFYKSAFLKTWKDYVLVFTEHHGFHVYHKTDLVSYLQLSSTDVECAIDKQNKDSCYYCKKEFFVDELKYGKNPHDMTDDDIIVLCRSCYNGEHQEII